MRMKTWRQGSSRSTPNIVTGGSSVHPDLARTDSHERVAEEGEGGGANPQKELAKYIGTNITGGARTFQGPFGRKQLVPCDSLYSGCSLSFLENYIGGEVLPMLSSSKGSTATVTTLQTAMYMDEVRNIIIKATNAGPEDEILFLPPSSYKSPSEYFVAEICDRLYVSDPIVFVSEQADDNDLRPWVEVGGTIMRIPDTDQGKIDAGYLRDLLEENSKSDRPLIGFFSACAEISGTLNEDLNLTALLHLFGAIAVWDYAAAAPSVQIDMNPEVPDDPEGYFCKDALFFSVCNFPGGLQSCNIMIMKKELVNRNPRPNTNCKGINASRTQNLLLDASQVVGIVRAGLAVELKQTLGAKFIMEREEALCELAKSKLDGINELVVLSHPCVRSRSTLSFMVKHEASNLFLHHGFVVTLLSDLFGIQARSVNAAKHTYGRKLVGIDGSGPLAEKFEAVLKDSSNFAIIDPGFVQIDLQWYNEQNENEFILNAIRLVAESGWQFLPQYNFAKETGEWSHMNNLAFSDRKCLGEVKFEGASMTWPQKGVKEKTAFILDDALLKAKEAIKSAKKVAGNVFVPKFSMLFSEATQSIRWFLLPDEAKSMMTSTMRMLKAVAHKCDDRLRIMQYPSAEKKDEAEAEVEINPIGTLGGNVVFPQPLKSVGDRKMKRKSWMTSRVEVNNDREDEPECEKIVAETVLTEVGEGNDTKEVLRELAEEAAAKANERLINGDAMNGEDTEMCEESRTETDEAAAAAAGAVALAENGKCGDDSDSTKQKSSPLSGLWKKFVGGSQPKKRKTGGESPAADGRTDTMELAVSQAAAAEAANTLQQEEEEEDAETASLTTEEGEPGLASREVEAMEACEGSVGGGSGVAGIGTGMGRSLEMIKEEQEDEVKLQKHQQLPQEIEQ